MGPMKEGPKSSGCGSACACVAKGEAGGLDHSGRHHYGSSPNRLTLNLEEPGPGVLTGPSLPGIEESLLQPSQGLEYP